VRVIETAAAPLPVGPYSQAIVHGGLVFASGQIPLDPATGKLVEGPIEAQAERVLQNLKAVLEAAGSGMQQVLRASVYVTDLSLFARINAVYGRFFAVNPPARSTVQVAALPLGALIEIDVVATLERP
jgi:2-iminobutanoate/2-iminopropanoate deaminase